MPSQEAIDRRNLRAAKLAHVLAQGVRDGMVNPSDARAVIVQQLRGLNTNQKLTMTPRSVGADAVIKRYAATGKKPPQNGSSEALQADHYNVITKEQVGRVETVEAWLGELARMHRSTACVTEAEHRSLARFERQGLLGPEKYKAAGIEFIDETLPWDA